MYTSSLSLFSANLGTRKHERGGIQRALWQMGGEGIENIKLEMDGEEGSGCSR
jgi:hypothetical protein